MNYIHNPDDAETNFQLGYEYEKEGQTAAAFSFYLRAAEKFTDPEKQYESLIRGSYCFAKQGRRNFSVKGLLQQALCTCPTRPEAYFLLSRHHERANEWHESYMFSTIGLKVVNFNDYVPLRTDVEYPGFPGLLFQKGISAWWAGLPDESKSILSDLYYNYDIDHYYKNLVKENLNRIGVPTSELYYDGNMKDRLKVKFNNVERINSNNSKSFQDMFVLSVLNGKENGIYLEIGLTDPVTDNNTVLLEKEFKWKGISVDSNEKVIKDFFHSRTNTGFCLNPLEIDYNALMHSMALDTVIDYLQINCESPLTSYQALTKILPSDYKFAVITFKHDFYKDSLYKELSRDYLKNKGYELVVNDIVQDNNNSYEDWWIHPELVNKEIVNKLKSESELVCASAHMLG